MAVLYRLSQNKMSTSKAKGKWFAQAVMTGTIDTDALAEIMQRNCTVKNGGAPTGGEAPGEGD